MGFFRFCRFEFRRGVLQGMGESKITHSPQDCIYGPLTIPSYCWKIIDTCEFQRLRQITQLGSVSYVYPSANHTRFEHSLGCCHLACKFMNHISEVQPKLEIEPNHIQAVVIAALCHCLGCGPFSSAFRAFAREIDTTWSQKEMSTKMLRYIIDKYQLNFSKEVIDAACEYIYGNIYEKYPHWLSQVVVNHKTAIDIVKFDRLSRDSSRSLNSHMFEYERLIFNCRVIDDQLTWKISEVPTIESLFYTMNDMHLRVYKHRVVQSISCMIQDIFSIICDKAKISESLNDPKLFSSLNDDILYQCELGMFGQEAKELVERILCRKLYSCVDEIRIKPDDENGFRYSQKSRESIVDDILRCSNECDRDKYRVVSMRFKYGLSKTKHPLLSILFWKKDNEKIIYLKDEEISCIVPAHFTENAMRVFVTDKDEVPIAKVAFQKWAEQNPFFK
ncbi:HD domain containing protein [Histomonas meleagridis]|uniref:HD domain containing protein n=1 Tax=Histomonas meleagridis TaxID=135588 RepID=UPI00355A2BD4|nr:HD domain containing protein [Histomonas meleagridis]KAH0799833.1 HD domain containing protein [Histomonas meleagridis]